MYLQNAGEQQKYRRNLKNSRKIKSELDGNCNADSKIQEIAEMTEKYKKIGKGH